MSDGGRGSGDEFGRAICKVAVAQICDSVGFHSSRQSALDALADVAIRFIVDLGRAASFSANLSNRNESNVFDVIQGLEDLGFSHGFTGASDVRRCLVNSGAVRDIIRFVREVEEVPFACSLPKFPVVRNQRPTPSFAQIGEKPAWDNIPDWLPPFPNPHTYIHTPVWNERETDLRSERIEQERQRRKAEKSLLGLQQRLACNSVAADIIGQNPFCLPPLLYGEKPVSDIVVVPDQDDAKEKRLSVLETFAPAIEAAKEGSMEDISERRDLPRRRPKVQFRLGVGKKTLALPLPSKASGRSDSSWLRDDERDDRKRRAERILKEAMENGKDLIQM